MDISEQIKIVFHGVNFPNVHLSAGNPFDNSQAVDLSIKPKVFYPQDKPLDFRIVFNVEIRADNFFFLSLQAIGQFSIDKEVDSGVKKNFVNVNAPAIVFPYIRSFVAMLTSNLGDVTGAILLPPQFFKGPLEEITINSQSEGV